MLFSFFDDIMIPSGGMKAKDNAQSIFGQKVLCLNKFQGGGLLGSHSIWCGISKDDRDSRGRWKGNRRASD